jgi:hypothetical protein
MRERAHLAGGWLTAGPDGEHFRVTAFIPYGAWEGRSPDDIAGTETGGPLEEIAGAEAQPALAATGLPRLAGAAGEADDRD